MQHARCVIYVGVPETLEGCMQDFHGIRYSCTGNKLPADRIDRRRWRGERWRNFRCKASPEVYLSNAKAIIHQEIHHFTSSLILMLREAINELANFSQLTSPHYENIENSNTCISDNESKIINRKYIQANVYRSTTGHVTSANRVRHHEFHDWYHTTNSNILKDVLVHDHLYNIKRIIIGAIECSFFTYKFR